MSTAPSTPPASSDSSPRAAFFRQSGWLMIANIAGGLLMWLVHFLAKKIPSAEYGVFGTLLAVAMCVPTLPMQMVMAHQTAQALANDKKRELSSTIRMIWLGTFLITLLLAIGVFFSQQAILNCWQMTNPAGLWITVAVVLLSLWAPLFWGVLQGRQNFMWLGWSMILNGVSRIGVAIIAVVLLGGYAAGMMVGVLMGFAVATLIGVWQTRDLWLAPAQPFNWRGVLGQVIPLMVGYGAFQFLFTADTLFIKAHFTGAETAFYVSAGTLSRALMWMVGPLAMVMFPRIVHSAAKSEKTNLMALVLGGTALLAIAGAAFLSFLGPIIVRLVYKADYVQGATLVLPWYAGAMVPLALANVLLNNLLARSSFKVVPALLLLAAGYAVTLNAVLTHSHSLISALQTLGIFNLLLLAVSGLFTWLDGRKGPKGAQRPA